MRDRVHHRVPGEFGFRKMKYDNPGGTFRIFLDSNPEPGKLNLKDGKCSLSNGRDLFTREEPGRLGLPNDHLVESKKSGQRSECVMIDVPGEYLRPVGQFPLIS